MDNNPDQLEQEARRQLVFREKFKPFEELKEKPIPENYELPVHNLQGVGEVHIGFSQPSSEQITPIHMEDPRQFWITIKLDPRLTSKEVGELASDVYPKIVLIEPAVAYVSRGELSNDRSELRFRRFRQVELGTTEQDIVLRGGQPHLIPSSEIPDIGLEFRRESYYDPNPT